jgi:ABC-2 type transport system permease protein
MGLVRFSWRQVWKGALIWSAVIAVVVISGVKTYNTAYASALSRQVLAQSVAKMPALQALYGRATAVDTVGGFLTWRYGDLMTVVVALWALLTTTRLMRGDEEALRTEVLLASPVSPRRLMTNQVAVIGLGCALVWTCTSMVAMANGLPAWGSVLFGLMVASGGLMFAAVASVTCQLFGTRRRAAGWAGAILGASYLVRAVGDGSARLSWLASVSPLGWAERIAPYSGTGYLPIVVIVAVSGSLVAVAFALRERRDTGQGLIGERAGRKGLRSMPSALALDWHLSTGALIAWTVGVTIEMFVIGYLTKDVIIFTQDNASINEMVTKMFGFSIGTPAGYLGLAFTVAAMVLGVYAGTHLVSAREEEAAGRADNLLVGGIGRVLWLMSRLLIAMGAMAALAFAAAVGAWVGVLASGASIGLLDSFKGAANVLPVAVFFGSLAVLAFGVAPRTTAYVAFGSVTSAYVVQIVAGLTNAPSWLIDVSPFTHLAPVPATGPNTTATLVLLGLSLACTAAGTLAFRRRDIAVD